MGNTCRNANRLLSEMLKSRIAENTEEKKKKSNLVKSHLGIAFKGCRCQWARCKCKDLRLWYPTCLGWERCGDLLPLAWWGVVLVSWLPTSCANNHGALIRFGFFHWSLSMRWPSSVVKGGINAAFYLIVRQQLKSWQNHSTPISKTAIKKT